MNEALSLYEDEERVISVHGYIYPIKKSLPDTFFIKGADCLGGVLGSEVGICLIQTEVNCFIV